MKAEIKTLDGLPDEAVLTNREYAAITRKTMMGADLERHRGRGPAYFRDGSRIKYLVKDVREYIKKNKVYPEAEKTA